MKKAKVTIEAKPPIFVDIGEIVQSHPVYVRFQPTETSRLGGILSNWAQRFGDITPVEKRLEGLRTALKDAEAQQKAVTWEDDVELLVRLDPLVWGILKFVAFSEAELIKRQNSAQSYDSQIQAMGTEVSVLIVKRAQLASDEVRSLLLKSERESQAKQITNQIMALVGHDVAWSWEQELASRRNPRQEAATARLQAQLNRESAERNEKEIALRQSAPVESMPMGGMVR